jgi:hypothetical protein
MAEPGHFVSMDLSCRGAQYQECWRNEPKAALSYLLEGPLLAGGCSIALQPLWLALAGCPIDLLTIAFRRCQRGAAPRR